eukprot:g1288.t1
MMDLVNFSCNAEVDAPPTATAPGAGTTGGTSAAAGAGSQVINLEDDDVEMVDVCSPVQHHGRRKRSSSAKGRNRVPESDAQSSSVAAAQSFFVYVTVGHILESSEPADVEVYSALAEIVTGKRLQCLFPTADSISGLRAALVEKLLTAACNASAGGDPSGSSAMVPRRVEIALDASCDWSEAKKKRRKLRDDGLFATGGGGASSSSRAGAGAGLLMRGGETDAAREETLETAIPKLRPPSPAVVPAAAGQQAFAALSVAFNELISAATDEEGEASQSKQPTKKRKKDSTDLHASTRLLAKEVFESLSHQQMEQDRKRVTTDENIVAAIGVLISCAPKESLIEDEDIVIDDGKSSANGEDADDRDEDGENNSLRKYKSAFRFILRFSQALLKSGLEDYAAGHTSSGGAAASNNSGRESSRIDYVLVARSLAHVRLAVDYVAELAHYCRLPELQRELTQLWSCFLCSEAPTVPGASANKSSTSSSSSSAVAAGRPPQIRGQAPAGVSNAPPVHPKYKQSLIAENVFEGRCKQLVPSLRSFFIRSLFTRYGLEACETACRLFGASLFDGGQTASEQDRKKYAPLGLSGAGTISLSEFIDPDCTLLDEWRAAQTKAAPKAKAGLNLTQRLATVVATLEYEAEDLDGRSKRVAENWQSSLGLAVRDVPRDARFPLQRSGGVQDHVRAALFVVVPTTTTSSGAAPSGSSGSAAAGGKNAAGGAKNKRTKRQGAQLSVAGGAAAGGAGTAPTELDRLAAYLELFFSAVEVTLARDNLTASEKSGTDAKADVLLGFWSGIVTSQLCGGAAPKRGGRRNNAANSNDDSSDTVATMKAFDPSGPLNGRLGSEVAKKILDIVEALRTREVYACAQHFLREAHLNVRPKIESLAQQLNLSPPDCCYFLLHLFLNAFQTLATSLELPGASTCRDEPRALCPEACSICMEELVDPKDAVVFSKCMHYLCRSCAHGQLMIQAAHRNCPHCRQPIHHQEKVSSSKNQAMTVFGEPLKFVAGNMPPTLTAGEDLQKSVEASLREAPQLLTHPFGRFFWQERVAKEDIAPVLADQDNVVSQLQQKIVFATKVESAATAFRRKVYEVLEEEDNDRGADAGNGQNDEDRGSTGDAKRGTHISSGCSPSLWKHRRPVTLHVLRGALAAAKSTGGKTNKMNTQSKTTRAAGDAGGRDLKTLDLLLSSGSSALLATVFRIPTLLRFLYVVRSKFSAEMLAGMTVANLKDSVRGKALRAEEAELSRLLSVFIEVGCLLGITSAEGTTTPSGAGTAVAKASVETLDMVRVCEPQGFCEEMIASLLRWHNRLVNSGGGTPARTGKLFDEGTTMTAQDASTKRKQPHTTSKASNTNVVKAFARYASSATARDEDSAADESEQTKFAALFAHFELAQHVLPLAVAFRNSAARSNSFDLHSVNEIVYHRYFAGKPVLPESLCELVFRLVEPRRRSSDLPSSSSLATAASKNLEQWSRTGREQAEAAAPGGSSDDPASAYASAQSNRSTKADQLRIKFQGFEVFDSAACASRSLQIEVGQWRLPELLDAISKMEMICRFLSPASTPTSTNTTSAASAPSGSMLKNLPSVGETPTAPDLVPLLQFVDTKLVNLSKELPAGLRKLFSPTGADAQLRVGDAATLAQLLRVRRTIFISSSSSRGVSLSHQRTGTNMLSRQPFFKGKHFHAPLPGSVKPHLGRTIELQPTALLQWVCSLHQMLTLWTEHEDLSSAAVGNASSTSAGEEMKNTSSSSDAESKQRDAAKQAAQAFLLGEAAGEAEVGALDRESQAPLISATGREAELAAGAKPPTRAKAKAKAKAKSKAKAKPKAKGKAKGKAASGKVPAGSPVNEEDDLLAEDEGTQGGRHASGSAKAKVKSKGGRGTAPATPAGEGAPSASQLQPGSSASSATSAVLGAELPDEVDEGANDAAQHSPRTGMPPESTPRTDFLRPLPEHALAQYQPTGALPLPHVLQVRHAVALFFWLADHLFDTGGSGQRGR